MCPILVLYGLNVTCHDLEFGWAWYKIYVAGFNLLALHDACLILVIFDLNVNFRCAEIN